MGTIGIAKTDVGLRKARNQDAYGIRIACNGPGEAAFAVVCDGVGGLADGEVASKLITCTVQGARSEESAERLAKAVVGSSLVKAAMFGSDANWGRVLCAMGYSKAPFRPEHVDVTFQSQAGSVPVCRQGDGLPFDEDAAKRILSEKEVVILVDLHEGDEAAECWGCDLTYDYVKINGDYRT